MGGRPCIRDLRVTVGTIVGCWRRATTWTQCWPRTRTLNATTSARCWLTPRGAARSRKSRSVRVEAPDRASGYEPVPVSARIPQNPVFIGLDQSPNGSEKVRNRLAGAETAGSTAGSRERRILRFVYLERRCRRASREPPAPQQPGVVGRTSRPANSPPATCGAALVLTHLERLRNSIGPEVERETLARVASLGNGSRP